MIGSGIIGPMTRIPHQKGASLEASRTVLPSDILSHSY